MAKGVKRRYRQIEKIEAKENHGTYGQWRKNFCIEYQALLARSRDNTYNALLKRLALKGEKITCHKGCTHCCFHYVAVPLAHGMVIVDYLYKQRQKLKQFIQSYDKWRHQGLNISNRIDRERARAFSLSMPVNDIIAGTRPLSAQYFEANITCPFLVNQTCLIYNIRPFPCSGQYSVTPPDLCAPDIADKAVIYQLVHDDEDLIKFLELAGADLMVNEMTLPIMVYRLLTQGASSVLDSLDVQNRVGSSRKVAAY